MLLQNDAWKFESVIMFNHANFYDLAWTSCTSIIDHMSSLACWLLLRLFRVLPFGSWSVSPPSVVIKLPLVMSCRQVVMFLARMCFFQSYPERFYFEGLLEFAGASVPTVQYLPIYFGNVCLRFLPVSAQALLGCMGWRRLFRKRIFSKKCYRVVLYTDLLSFQVFDIVIQRFLELSPVYKSLESLLDHLGCLYKFHGLLLHFIVWASTK